MKRNSNTNHKKSRGLYVAGYKVGTLEGDTLKRHVHFETHILQHPRGWSFDLDALKEAKEYGVTKVEVTDDDSGRRYCATLDDFFQKGVLVGEWAGHLCLEIAHWTPKTPRKRGSKGGKHV